MSSPSQVITSVALCSSNYGACASATVIWALLFAICPEVQAAANWGFIDRAGKLVIAGQYRMVGNFSQGVAHVQSADRIWQFIGRSGHSAKEATLPPQLYPVAVKHSLTGIAYGYANELGKIVISPRFKAAGQFHEGLAAVGGSGGYGFLDEDGRIRIAFPDAEMLGGLSGGVSRIQYASESLGSPSKWGLVDRRGKVIVAPKFDYIDDFSEGLAAAVLDKRWGYIDVSGNWVIAPRFARAGSFHEGLAACANISVGASDPLRWGFIDASGEFVIEPKFAEAESFSEGLATAALLDKNHLLFGFINHAGVFEIRPQFLEAHAFSEGLCGVAVITDEGLSEQIKEWEMHHLPAGSHLGSPKPIYRSTKLNTSNQESTLWDGKSVD